MQQRPQQHPARKWLRTMVLTVALGLLGLQATGTTHALADIWQVACGTVLHADAACPDEGPDTDCPPGCPTCHCSHSTAPSLPSRGALPLLQPLPRDVHGTSWAAPLGAPRNACVGLLLRPPRLT